MAVRAELNAEPLPGYRLIDRLGGGGFGEVWRAEAPGGMHKAIKFVFGDLSAAGDKGQRAEQELKALKRVLTVRHPYILSIERYDIIDGQLMIVMELADRNLWDRFKDCRTQGLPGIPRDELLRYMEETAEALDLMNQEYQLQHLDIKPQNIFLVHNHVKVADFGLVKDLEGASASITGGLTPVYAAPETFDGRVSRFSDQYSFAILYQELLTGQRPFNGTNVRQLIMQHISAVPDVSPLPAGERDAVSRALSKQPAHRFPSCREFVDALRGASIPAPLPPTAPSDLLPADFETIRPVAAPPTPIIQTSESWQSGPPSSGPPTANIRSPQPPRHMGPTRLVEVVTAAPTESSGNGCLFPAVLVGLGQTGLSLLQRARDLLESQAAPMHQMPSIRSLLIDTDPEIARVASRERSPAALSPQDILIAPLNRPSHYQKPREGRPALDKWLNVRLVYRIPRSMVTTGIRALGRLAFMDNHRIISRRLRTELESATDPAALQSSIRASKLGMRTNRPRVYVLAGIAGGTGGGMFLDAAYTARDLLRRMGYENPDVVGVLLVPPLDKGRGRAAATGNTYAALAELEHFGTSGNTFHAHYDGKEQPLVDEGPPFSRLVLLPLPEEGDEVAAREVIDLAGQFLFRDLATPLGKAADLARAGLPVPWESRGRSFSTFGLFQLSWPRRTLLSAAGRRLCSRMVQRWSSKDSKPIREQVADWVKAQWAERGLAADRFIERLQDNVAKAAGRAPEDAFSERTNPLRPASSPSQSGKRSSVALPPPPAEQIADVLRSFDELLGPIGDEPTHQDPPEFPRLLAEAAEKLSSEWSQKLAEMSVKLIEQPAFRLSGAEEAIRQSIASLESALQSHEPLAADLLKKANDAYSTLYSLALPKPGQKRPMLSAHEVHELLRAYPRWRWQAAILGHLSAAFVGLRGHLSDELREINFCRVRLGELQRLFDEVPPEEASPSAQGTASIQGTSRSVFAGGSRTLKEAVETRLKELGPDNLLELDGLMQRMLKKSYGALVNICLTKQNPLKDVHSSMLEVARGYLAERQPETSAAELFLEQHPDEEEAEGEAMGFWQEAGPELAVARTSHGTAPAELCVLACPEDEAGERLRTLLARAVPASEAVPALSLDDVVVYRERLNLPLSALPHLGAEGRDAAIQMSAADLGPHTRIDVDFSR